MSSGNGTLEIFPDPASLAQHVADWIVMILAQTKEIRISLSGGSTPKTLYALLASDAYKNRIPWDRIHWYWGDERFVPHDDPESNYRMAREAMLAHVPVPPANIHPIPTDGSPDAAAARYENQLQAAYGAATLDAARPFFDITLLGLGADGHTASLLPGDAVLQERRRWVAAVAHGRPEVRITMTYPLIESSRYVAFLVTGHEKAATLAAIRTSASDVPAAKIRPVGKLIWFVDQAAAQSIPPRAS